MRTHVPEGLADLPKVTEQVAESDGPLESWCHGLGLRSALVCVSCLLYNTGSQSDLYLQVLKETPDAMHTIPHCIRLRL